MPNNVVVTTFYENGKAIMKAEWYEPLSENELKKRIDMCVSMGFGIPDALTDTTGRMIHLPKAFESTESA